jgi:hypothetical protein
LPKPCENMASKRTQRRGSYGEHAAGRAGRQLCMWMPHSDGHQPVNALPRLHRR